MEQELTFIVIGVYVVYIIFGILSLILFFKVWNMTNNVEQILKIMQSRSVAPHVASQNAHTLTNERTTENSVFCPHCGTKLTSNSGFCKNCGKEISK